MKPFQTAEFGSLLLSLLYEKIGSGYHWTRSPFLLEGPLRTHSSTHSLAYPRAYLRTYLLAYFLTRSSFGPLQEENGRHERNEGRKEREREKKTRKAEEQRNEWVGKVGFMLFSKWALGSVERWVNVELSWYSIHLVWWAYFTELCQLFKWVGIIHFRVPSQRLCCCVGTCQAISCWINSGWNWKNLFDSMVDFVIGDLLMNDSDDDDDYAHIMSAYFKKTWVRVVIMVPKISERIRHRPMLPIQIKCSQSVPKKLKVTYSKR